MVSGGSEDEAATAWGRPIAISESARAVWPAVESHVDVEWLRDAVLRCVAPEQWRLAILRRRLKLADSAVDPV